MSETKGQEFVRRLDWWDCLLLEASASNHPELHGDLVTGLRTLGVATAHCALLPSEAGPRLRISLGSERPTLLEELAPGAPPRIPVEHYRPILLQSRWVHACGAGWSLPVLREASVRGICTSLSGQLPGTDLGALEEPVRDHLRYVQEVVLRLDPPAGLREALSEASSLAEKLAAEGPETVLLELPGQGCLLREETGEKTWHESRQAELGPALRPAAFEALLAGYLAARRAGIKARRALVWGLLSSAHRAAWTGEVAEAGFPDRPALDRALLRTTFEAKVLR